MLVVEDDQAMRELLAESLIDDGFSVETAGDGRTGIARVRQGGVDLVISDVRMPDVDGLDLLREVRAGNPAPHVITITAFGSIETAKRAIKLGAYDYITKPFEIDKLLVVVRNALGERALQGEVESLRKTIAHTDRIGELLGKSGRMQEVFDLIERFAPSPAPVLITGESGTGKELVAKAIHFQSPRRNAPFVAMNCAAIPDSLIESELFGHKRGAFTDARADRDGLFVQANGGTLFLDEIGELSLGMQAKLLRAIQEREVRPLGSSKTERVDLRIVAATNRDLDRCIAEGFFRSDLFYRLNVLVIALPPLRARLEDVPLLAEHFLQKCASREGRTVRGFDPGAARALMDHDWPGNVRELENVVERAVLYAEKDLVSANDLPQQVKERRPSDALSSAVARGLTLAELEREYILQVLAAEGGNKTRAAQRLGLDRKTLYRKLEEYARADTPAPSSAPGAGSRGEDDG